LAALEVGVPLVPVGAPVRRLVHGTVRPSPAEVPRVAAVVMGAQFDALAAAADGFRGDAALVNPEVLLLAAATSCQLLSFLAVAARARVDVVAYVDDATARMPEDDLPIRITEVVLRPKISVRGAPMAKVERLVRLAHEQCYIANSLSASFVIEPTIEVIS
jgi:organic hydroperoxide reductase OsmC/OhrA